MRRSAWTVGLLVAALGAGCGSTYNWEGTWEGDRPISTTENADPAVVESLKRVKLTLKGGSFQLFDEGLPKEGSWTTSGNEARLEIKSVMRQPSQEPGKTLRVRNPQEIEYGDGSGGPTVVLKRVATSTQDRP